MGAPGDALGRTVIRVDSFDNWYVTRIAPPHVIDYAIWMDDSWVVHL
jgi:ABC-type transport system involved in cytochrome bd biosynthesis fused ATPase/permease subunit